MASNYTRYIEFKVKGQELTRAVDKIFKGVNKIEIGVEKVNKKAKITGDVIKDVEKNVKKADTAVQKLAKDFEKVTRAAQRTQTSVGKLLDKMRAFRPGGGPGGGILRTVAEFGALEVVVRKVVPALTQFAAAHSGLLTATAAVGAAFKVGIPTIYSWGKAVRQAEQSTKDFIRIAGSSGLRKAVQSMFPAGSYLGGNRDLAAEKAAAAALKQKVEESKKLANSTEKVAKQYKLVATGLNKSREQLSKLKKIQDQLLSSSKGYENITKKILKVERDITKEERKRADIRRRLDWKGDAKKFAMNAIGGRLGAVKLGAQALGGLGGGFLADAGIRKVSDLLGKQAGLFKVVTVSASKFFQGLKAVDQGARKGAASLDKYGRIVVNLVREHTRLIQATTGLVAGLDAVGRFAPTAYNLGKGFRQLTFDIRKATEAIKKYGLEAGILSFADKGSLAGKRFRNLMRGRPDALKHPSFEDELKAWGGASGTSGIRSQVDGLTKVGDILKRNKEIQENMTANVRGPYLQAAVAVKKAQFQYNLELAKTQLIQKAVTADIWIAKRGLADMVKLAQGVAGAIKGLGGGVIGGLLGGAKGLATGKAGSLGQAAVVIGISDAVKRLSQHIPFISQAWKDNIQVFSTWTKRVTEGLAAATIAHGAFAKAISAAQWTVGAISGFARWEKEAMLSFHRVRKGWQDLAHDISKWQVKGMLNMRRNNPLTNAWDKIVGGRRQEIAEIYNVRKPTKDPMIVRMERALKTSQEMLKRTDTAAANYEQRQQRVLSLERAINSEMAKRKGILEKMSATPSGPSSFIHGNKRAQVYTNVARGRQMRADSPSGFGDWSKQVNQTLAAEEKRVQNLSRIVRINRKLTAQGKTQLSTFNLLSAREREMYDAATEFAAFRETSIRDRKRTARQRLGNIRKQRADRRMQTRENLMLGAGFPMLFGGGAGAVGGGLLGAGVQSQMGKKGGFGAQILLSALGQQIDTFIAKIGEVGKAFNAITPNVDTLIEAMGISGTELEKQMKAYKEVATSEKALAMATEQMSRIIGKTGVKALKDYGEASTKWSNDFATAMLKIQAAVARFLLWASNPWRKEGEAKSIRSQTRVTMGSGDNEVMNKIKEQIRQVHRDPIDKWGGPGTGKADEIERLMKLADAEQIRLNKANQLGIVTATIDERIENRVKTMNEEVAILENTLALGTKEAGIQAEIAELIKEAKGDEKSIEEIQRQKIENAVRYKAELQEQVEMWNQIKDTLASGITNAINGLIDGTKTLKESLAGILRQMAQLIIQKQIAGLVDKIPSPVPSKKKAAGGPVTGGETYLVGEKGPEIFTPGRSGGIIPNHAIGGSSNVTINVDAGGSSMQGDAEQAGQLGRMLAAAVQDEMARQKRPGGILY